MEHRTSMKARRAKRGAVMVEYAFLLLWVMVPTSAALIAGGKVMYDFYKTTRAALLNSNP